MAIAKGTHAPASLTRLAYADELCAYLEEEARDLWLEEGEHLLMILQSD